MHTDYAGPLHIVSRITTVMRDENIPLDKMYQQHPCRLLHRLDKYTNLRGHGRVGKLEGVEVQDGIKNSIRGRGSSTNKNRQAVQRSVYYEGVAAAWATLSAGLWQCMGGGGFLLYLLLSWSTPSILSRRPVASASSCLWSRKG